MAGDLPDTFAIAPWTQARDRLWLKAQFRFQDLICDLNGALLSVEVEAQKILNIGAIGEQLFLDSNAARIAIAVRGTILHEIQDAACCNQFGRDRPLWQSVKGLEFL